MKNDATNSTIPAKPSGEGWSLQRLPIHDAFGNDTGEDELAWVAACTCEELATACALLDVAPSDVHTGRLRVAFARSALARCSARRHRRAGGARRPASSSDGDAHGSIGGAP